ncbi:MAG TPA: GrpB family protein [Acidimicrobiales bacterium]|nr:GrpB family protein [Acidimicrobiales bacterium]
MSQTGEVEADPSLSDHLSEVLVHGLKPVWVELVDHDPTWAAHYERYAAGLQEVLGDRVRLIEHIGSTSVAGLAAKPVIDIVIGVDDPDDEGAYVPDLEGAGYDLRVREPGHRCLRGGDSGMPVNLHCYRPDSPEVALYLRFRDRLRSSEPDRELYAATKRSLATREWPDMNFYADAKGPVIRDILGRAQNRTAYSLRASARVSRRMTRSMSARAAARSADWAM